MQQLRFHVVKPSAPPPKPMWSRCVCGCTLMAHPEGGACQMVFPIGSSDPLPRSCPECSRFVATTEEGSVAATLWSLRAVFARQLGALASGLDRRTHMSR